MAPESPESKSLERHAAPLFDEQSHHPFCQTTLSRKPASGFRVLHWVQGSPPATVSMPPTAEVMEFLDQHLRFLQPRNFLRAVSQQLAHNFVGMLADHRRAAIFQI